MDGNVELKLYPAGCFLVVQEINFYSYLIAFKDSK